MDEERETLLTSQREDPPVPILTVFQFHDDMPHETVLNLPLHLSRVMNKSSSVKLRYNYVDSPVPLRVCDTTMNVVVLMRSLGDFYVCYYYTFQQTEFDKNAAENAKVNEIASGRINFAYSVILLHHGIVLNCTVPSVPCNLARKIDPVFCLYKDQHLMVYADGMFTHLLDVGIEHEPCCHILMPSRCLINSNYNGRLLVPVPGKTTVLINSTNLDLIELSIKKEQLIEVFTNGGATTTTDKLSILHYLLVHENEISAVGRILTSVVEMLPDLCISNLFKEILVGNCYAVLNRFLSADAMPLLRLLPLSTLSANIKYESKADKYELVLEEELMSNASVILLTPRQRLIPFRSDIWMKLWDLLPDHRVNNYRLTRFKNSAVTEKLSVSLICYQPEALSRCTTPLSPGAPHIASTGMLADLANMSRSNKFGIDPLPFVEIEASAASKQEHVISVNLREISMHLVKHGQTPMQVHAVSTRYVSAQLETARLLCSFLTKAVSIDTRYGERGFQLIDNLEQKHRRIFFAILERYYLAVDTLSFPLPQGFPSFFAYLGYKTLPMNKFVDYGRANVFQLNIDVMKTIMADLSSDEKDELRFKLSLLSHLPRSRVKRLMNQWSHPVSLMIRAREHSLNIVSGISVINHRASNQSRAVRHNFSGKGVAAFPSEERLSPLDTFLELLTAKANLSEIDFNLLIEATAASTKEFL